MSKFPNEQQLTAYVLGELPEAERLRVNEAIRQDAALAAEVERLRKTAVYLKASLRRDSELKLSPDRRVALETALRKRAPAGGGMPAWIRALLRPYVLGPVAAAALILIVVWQGGVPKATSPVADKAEELQMYAEPPAAPPPEPAASAPPAAERLEEAAAPLKSARREAVPKALENALGGSAAPAAPPAAEQFERDVESREERMERQDGKSAMQAQAAAPMEAKRATPAAGVRTAKDAVPNRVRIGAYAVEVRMPPALGGAADGERLARQIAERAVARQTEAKKNDSAAEAGDARRKAKHEGFEVLQQDAGAKAATCEITVTVVDSSAGEPGAATRRQVPCSLDALVTAFEEIIKARQ